jgi:hypothetical protein
VIRYSPDVMLTLARTIRAKEEFDGPIAGRLQTAGFLLLARTICRQSVGLVSPPIGEAAGVGYAHSRLLDR